MREAMWVTDLEHNMLLTVGREFHPAPKMESIILLLILIIHRYVTFEKGFAHILWKFNVDYVTAIYPVEIMWPFIIRFGTEVVYSRHSPASAANPVSGNCPQPSLVKLKNIKRRRGISPPHPYTMTLFKDHSSTLINNLPSACSRVSLP